MITIHKSDVEDVIQIANGVYPETGISQVIDGVDLTLEMIENGSRSIAALTDRISKFRTNEIAELYALHQLGRFKSSFEEFEHYRVSAMRLNRDELIQELADKVTLANNLKYSLDNFGVLMKAARENN